MYRTPSAWVNDCRMSGARFAFVEGPSDEWFWKKFIDQSNYRISPVDGWPNVIEIITEFHKAGLSDCCFGIVDRDFDDILSSKKVIFDNVFITDDHDIEMMMYHSNAFSAAILAIDKKNTIKEKTGNILQYVFGITDKIGYLKLCSILNELGLLFKTQSKKNHEIELPNYENIIDANGEYLGDKKLIDYIINWSKNNLKGLGKISNKEYITNSFNKAQITKYDSYLLSNGHDLSYLMPYILRRKYKLNGNHITSATFEIALFAAYDLNMLKTTKLYNSMIQWMETRGVKIFL